jgi:hypothetical protein
MKKLLLLSIMGCFACIQARAQLTPTLVHDVIPGTAGSYPHGGTVFNNELYFTATTPSIVAQIWKHDGSITSLETSLPFGGDVLQETAYGTANGQLYFFGTRDSVDNNRYIWSYSGSGNPIMLDSNYVGNIYCDMVSIGDTVYFNGTNIQSGVNGLYLIDAVTNNIQLVTDLGTMDINGSPVSVMTEMVHYNNKLYFVGTATGLATIYGEMFVHDPATGNTTQLPSLCLTCNNRSAPGRLYAGDNGKLYFTAVDAGDIRQLYEIDGDNPATQLTNLFLGVEGSWVAVMAESAWQNIVQKGNFVYFSGAFDIPVGYELMKYDLVNDTATLVVDISPSIAANSSPHDFIVFDNKVYFVVGGLWSTDGTASGTVQITDSTFSDVGDLVIYNNELYFTADVASTGYELYKLTDAANVVGVSMANSVKIYPVPVENELHFEIDLVKNSRLGIAIKDISGKVVCTSPLQQYAAGSAKITMPAQALAPGIYMYNIITDTGILIASGKINR